MAQPTSKDAEQKTSGVRGLLPHNCVSRDFLHAVCGMRIQNTLAWSGARTQTWPSWLPGPHPGHAQSPAGPHEWSHAYMTAARPRDLVCTWPSRASVACAMRWYSAAAPPELGFLHSAWITAAVPGGSDLVAALRAQVWVSLEGQPPESCLDCRLVCVQWQAQHLQVLLSRHQVDRMRHLIPSAPQWPQLCSIVDQAACDSGVSGPGKSDCS